MKLLYEASNFTIQARWVIPFAILGIIGVLLLVFSKKPFFKLLSAVCLAICAIAALRFCFGYMQVIHAYKQGKKFGYHLPSTQGGYIKRDGQYLKLGYITTEKGYVIVKIQERKQ